MKQCAIEAIIIISKNKDAGQLAFSHTLMPAHTYTDSDLCGKAASNIDQTVIQWARLLSCTFADVFYSSCLGVGKRGGLALWVLLPPHPHPICAIQLLSFASLFFCCFRPRPLHSWCKRLPTKILTISPLICSCSLPGVAVRDDSPSLG